MIFKSNDEADTVNHWWKICFGGNWLGRLIKLLKIILKYQRSTSAEKVQKKRKMESEEIRMSKGKKITKKD